MTAAMKRVIENRNWASKPKRCLVSGSGLANDEGVLPLPVIDQIGDRYAEKRQMPVSDSPRDPTKAQKERALRATWQRAGPSAFPTSRDPR